MALTYEVFDLPTLAVKEQLFYAPGQAFEGGFTSGGARIVSPEPGGRAFLDLQLSVNKNEWDYPFISWLMSNCSNGEIFRVRMVQTPQLVQRSLLLTDVNGNLWDNNQPWDNDKPWDGATFGPKVTTVCLPGANQVTVDMSLFGQLLRVGHVIGHMYDSYMIKKIAYDGANLATLTIGPPARRTLAVNDFMKFRPTFTGSMVNGANFRKTYDAADRGMIMPGKVTFSEVIL